MNLDKKSKRYIWIIILILSMTLIASLNFNRRKLGPIKHLYGMKNGEFSLGDSPYYTNYVKYFRGEATVDQITVPFLYRPLVPFLASLLPIQSPMTAINIINLFSLYIALFFLFHLLKSFEFSFNYAILGGFMFSISFPVFYYSTDGCIDTLAICLLTIGTSLIYREKWFYLCVVLILGSAVKEIVILLIPIAFGYLIIQRKCWIIIPTILTIAFLLPMFLIRSFFSEAGTYYWIPNFHTFFGNLRLRAFLSIILSFGVPGILSLGFPIYYKKIQNTFNIKYLFPLYVGIFSTILLVIYSMFSAYADGRFIWPMNIFTIPISLWILRDGILIMRNTKVA